MSDQKDGSAQETYSCPCGVGEEPCPGPDGKPACADKVGKCPTCDGWGYSAARTPAEGDTVPVPKAALAWLFGEDAAPDGKTFGEDEDAEIATPRKYTRRYWWRSRFRSMIPALSQPHPSTVRQAND